MKPPKQHATYAVPEQLSDTTDRVTIENRRITVINATNLATYGLRLSFRAVPAPVEQQRTAPAPLVSAPEVVPTPDELAPVYAIKTNNLISRVEQAEMATAQRALSDSEARLAAARQTIEQIFPDEGGNNAPAA